ncbi:Uric acid-xanthine permease [Tetrabaena socialis]|uniref:Uric acid-xanthine permease n=1 Tax=Tetrabaena socialis TaxID=47790 RepID=A0A2J7ZRT8_9CHLO|nr:Uric acid-xanthine permease [Tetrabaena socialis]|eukprot:PNH02982.1 Uric acid-xanthine permease [Tetrabaena socialis]
MDGEGGQQRRGIKEFLLGSYDFKYLCMPVFPYFRGPGRRGVPPPRFFSVNEFLGLFVALVMGLQHALAMVGGLITPPLLISNLAFGNRPNTKTPYAEGSPAELQRYLVQASLIVCGIMTFFQVAGFKIWRTPFMFGSGCLSCMGVSFTTVPIATAVLTVLIKEQGMTFEAAYGKFLGTCALCAIIPLIVAAFPIKVIRKVFPPIVCGVVIMMIGLHLIGAGFKNWGGGAFCADNYLHPPGTRACFLPASYPNGTSYLMPSQCWVGPGIKCGDATKTEPLLGTGAGASGAAESEVAWAAACLEGLAAVPRFEMTYGLCGKGAKESVRAVVGALEAAGRDAAGLKKLYKLRGSLPAPRALELELGASIKFKGKKYVTTSKIDTAPGITFLWTTTFPLGFYAPAIIPLCIVFIITSIETVGDTTATLEASRMITEGPDFTSRIKGALLNDGISGIFSALATSLPLTTFAQNNGVISLTNVASRQAGFAAAFWLFLLGILGKVGAWITTIPEAILGGMTTFLFANVIASGIKIIINGDPLTRRSRFILACSLALGVGVELVPTWATNTLWPITPGMNSGTRGVRDAIILVLSTSFTFSAVVAIILNLIIPADSTTLPANDGSGKDDSDVGKEGDGEFANVAHDVAVPTVVSVSKNVEDKTSRV